MTNALVRAFRGAITCEHDVPEEIYAATQALLAEMLSRNDLVPDDVISVLFTATADLTSAFPATAARGIGFSGVPLMCAMEIPVPGAKARVVRIMLHAYTTLSRDQVHHVYLGDAQSLRDDLV